ncbi:hypothetical protein BV898_17983 [Hypsibius exemplaris]|uniref:Peptidase S1 domain-containing protein n=1 Tax=Hypsibius exemplaris TaxID=2072580 RepID=A0A9X6NGP0_HYPEX|nr:hypothetical protein BV898_17983 [Hypsibius exemplaris]
MCTRVRVHRGSGRTDDLRNGGEVVPTIISGTDAKLNQICWQVRVLVKLGQSAIICGGSIIGSRTILTAGHCVFAGDLSRFQPDQFTVRIGAMDNRVGAAPAGCEEDFAVTKVTPHEAYVPTAEGKPLLNSNNDLALLTLARDIDFAKSKCACRLCLEDRVPDTNAQCIASGVGNQKVNQAPDENIDVVLQYAELDVKSQTSAECASSQDSTDDLNLFVCAGGTPRGTSTCQGDSGGPLACLDANGKFYSAGVTFFGNTGCPKDGPAHFTKTQAFLAWIRKNADQTDTLSFV